MLFWTLDAAVAAAALLLALAVDRWWGEPPAALHPVVWMGRALGACGARVAPVRATGRDLWSFWLAAIIWCALAAMVFGGAAALQWAAWAHLPAWGAALALGLLLKPLLAWRMLRGEVLAVEAALGESLEAGRARLAWLVSRDVQRLDATAVRESAIESLAENLSDSVVAPLLWFVLLGLPGAALYRFANTADAMWGYPGMRGGRYWLWAGKWAARADDVLSWLPARLTALLLWAAARGGVRWGALRLQARTTPSPNGGWPMGAMALALGVRLSKPGVYVLNAPGRAPQAADTQRAVHLASKTLLALVVLAVAALLLIAIVHTHV
ncbi:adenosylcobinamide-phosphate synthase CbiB [Diaphorobacter sp. J5-51]|uniref:adenosylcobinamide-phosphate synthase CbiB n=1 Tax=Diaphorobacter sp. J5-51 TaxID=680496 RepID=UPI000643A70B|nr:adenosylcobinamide-phosphate synthase CbiB [Diaphorobacter sp. J5-51]KLR59225.1 cobalamin biosynthesis protein CobD [Diaphorobacter sp. J5-51]